MKKFATAAILAALFVTAVPAQALAAVRIVKVQYDSPGTDSGSNNSLNAEWVKIRNGGSKAKQLKGWTLRDTSGHVYRFGSYRLGAGKAVTIHTGRGSNSGAHRYWNASGYVWNNSGDKAKLKNAGGTTVDTCSWTGGSTAIAC